jgi:tRNA(Ile)-lysidine synthase
MGPHPAVAQVRLAVRRCLTRAGLEPGDLVLAACSGGADSLALVAAVAFEAPRLGLTAGGVTVDHGLQAGSAGQAAEVAKVLTAIGLDPVLSLSAAVAARPGAAGCHGPTGTAAAGPAGAAARGSADPGAASRADPGDYPGPEAAAREARYRALDQAAAAAGAAAIMLGHTRDDQAETVLLGLARGSGSRSLAGMAERAGRYRRPFLAIGRDRTRAACAALGLEAWEDPHNADSSYARARVRHHALPALEAALGPGVAEALARTAAQLRADADALDELAGQAAERLTGAGPSLSAEALSALPAALRTRVLRRAAITAGCPAGSLTARHVAGLDELLTGWHGQRGVDLPGGVRGVRQCGKLRFSTGRTPDLPPGAKSIIQNQVDDLGATDLTCENPD